MSFSQVYHAIAIIAIFELILPIFYKYNNNTIMYNTVLAIKLEFSIITYAVPVVEGVTPCLFNSFNGTFLIAHGQSHSEKDTFHTSQLAHNLQTHSLEYVVYSTQSIAHKLIAHKLISHSFEVSISIKGVQVCLE